MNIWIVEQSSGSWDDFTTWPVKAFESKEEAEQWIVENNATLSAKLDKDREDAKEFEARYEELLQEHGLDDWDDQHPNFRKWRDGLDKLTTEWADNDRTVDYQDLHPYNIGNQIKLVFKS